jgi:hypothetical protein
LLRSRRLSHFCGSFHATHAISVQEVEEAIFP